MWDSAADIDLHVIDPAGEEIYHGNPRAQSGGELDTDANSRCTGANMRTETIRWPVGFAPPGRYTVRLNHWSSCGAPATNYVLQVVSGNSTNGITDSLTGNGTGDGLGAGTTVTTFAR